MHWLARSTAVVLAGAVGMLGAPGLASGADHASHGVVRIVVKATGRDGNLGTIGEDAVAVSLNRPTLGNEYRANLNGVLAVPPGKYFLAVDITSGPVAPATSDSGTLAARLLTVKRNRNVSFDARKGQPIVLSLKEPGAMELQASAGLCYGAGPGAQQLVSADNGPGNIFAVPFTDKNASFGYAANWRDSLKTQYVTSGVHAGGAPANPDYSFTVSKLAKLTFLAKSGDVAGTEGAWSLQQMAGCWLGDLTGTKPIPLPSRLTQYVSAGPWTIRFSPDGSQVPVRLHAGQRFTQTLAGAAVAPARWVIPTYDVNGAHNFYLPLYGFFSASDAGMECCANGTLRLSARGKVIRAVSFRNEASGFFRAKLPSPGWYRMTIDASRSAPPPGVSPAVLSTRDSLAWRFRASAADLRSSGANAPVSVSTFTPAGLDMSNDAAAGAVTPLRMQVWRGRSGRAFRLRTVRLQVSYDDGATWRSVALTAHGRYWLAEVPDPVSGFVSLRSTVTDMRGDSTVETVYRAYGVS